MIDTIEFIEFVKSILARSVLASEVAQFIQALLTFSYVPMQAFCKRIEPVGNLVLRTNTWNRINRRSNTKTN